jgi:hypothetical protein
MGGLLDAEIEVYGGLNSFHSAGALTLRQGEFVTSGLYREPIEHEEASLVYELDYFEEELRFSQLALRLPRVSIDGNGTVRDVLQPSRSILFEFTTDKTSLQDLTSYVPDRLIPERLLPLRAADEVEGFFQVKKARLEGPWADLTPQGLRKNPQMLFMIVQLEGCRFFLDPKLPQLRNVSGSITYEGDRAEFSGGRVEFLQSHLSEFRGSISRIHTDPRIALAFKGEIDLVSLSSLMRADSMPRGVRKAVDSVTTLSGRAKIEGAIQWPINKPFDLTYKGRITLGSSRIGVAGLPFPLTDLEGEIQCDDRAIKLSGFKGKLGNTLLKGTVSVTGYLRRLREGIALSNKPAIALDVVADALTIDHLLPNGVEGEVISIDPESIWVRSEVAGKLRIRKGLFKGFPFANLATSFTLKRGVMSLKEFRAEAPGGMITCGGWVNLKSTSGISFKLTPKIQHLDMTEVVSLFADQRKRPVLSGAIDLHGFVAGSGHSPSEIMESLNGDVRFRIPKGSIYRPNADEEGGLPYRQATGQILIKRGIASTSNLRLENDSIRLAIAGEADLRHKRLDVQIRVKALQTVDKILSNLPVAGWLLAGKDRSIFTFYYRVKGNFSDLKVEK